MPLRWRAALVLSSTLVLSAEEAGRHFQTIFSSSLERVGGTLEVRGSVVMTATGSPLTPDYVELTLSTFGERTHVSFDPQAADGLVVSYAGERSHATSVPYEVRFIRGNGDTYLDAGELAVLTVRLRSLPGAPNLRPGDRWTLSLTSQAGVTLEVSRRLPAGLSPVMLLR